MSTCFVIGPIGEAGSVIRANADDFMKYIVAPVVTDGEFGYDHPIRADNLNDPGRITSQIIKLLLDADLIIADLTGNNANVFYELCLRHSIGKPVVHMAHEGTSLSFDVRDNRTIFYTMHSRVAEAARTELAKQIRHVRKPGYKPMNPILETAAILNLEGSALPEQAALGQVLERLEQLSSNVADLRQQMRAETARSSVALSSAFNALNDATFKNSLHNGLISQGLAVGGGFSGPTGPTASTAGLGVTGPINALARGVSPDKPK